MSQENLGGLYYEIDMDAEKLIESSRKAKAEIDSLSGAADKASPSFDGMSKSAKSVASALAMPQVNKLSNQLAQLSGKIGASSDAAIDAASAQNKFSGIVGTVANKLGSGYVSNVGSATNSLIKHTKEALATAAAKVEMAAAVEKEANALKESASQLAAASAQEKKQAESAVLVAESELKAASAIFERKEADIASLEALLTRQKESLKQSEANLQISSSEKAVAQALKDRNAVEATQAKILKQSNDAVKEITTAEDKLTAAKANSAAASQKVTQTRELEAVATATSEKAADAAALATERLTLAARAQVVAVSAARSALALLGGPAGVLLLAAAGVYSLYQAMSNTKEIGEFNKKIEDSINKIETLNNAQARYAADKFGKDLESAKEKVDDFSERISNLKEVIEGRAKLGMDNSELTSRLIKLTALYNAAKAEQLKLADAQKKSNEQIAKTEKLSDAQVDAQNLIRESSKSLTEQNTLLARSIIDGDAAAKDSVELDNFKKKLNEMGIYGKDATEAIERFASEMQQNKDFSLAKAVEDSRQKVEELTIKLEQGEAAAAAFNAQMAIKNNGWDPDSDDAKAYIDNLKKIVTINKQISDKQKSDSANASSGKRDANAAESVAQKLENLRQKAELAADSTKELSREQAILVAQQSLGKAATKGQVEQAGRYAATAWDTANALKAQAAAEKLIPEKQEQTRYSQESKDLKVALTGNKITREEYNAAVERAEQQHQANLAQIRSDAVVSPVAESRGQIDPIQALANENAQKLKLMQEYQAQEQAILKQSYDAGYLTYQQFTDAKAATDSQYLMLKTAQDKQYQEQQTAAQWQLLSQQSLGYDMLTSAVDAFSGNASNALTGLLTGSMSVEDAMRSLGSTMLNSVVNSLVQVGVEALKNFIITETIGKAGQASAAAAAVAGGSAALAAWTPAAIAASIATGGTASATGLTAYQTAQAGGLAMSVLGARKNGGPVSAGGLYEFGEGNLPEVLQAGGKSYMLPGNNGRVFSNKDVTGAPVIPKASTGKQFMTPSDSSRSSSDKEANRSPVNFVLKITNVGTPQDMIDQRQTRGVTGQEVIEIIMADVRNSGPASSALANKMGTKLKPSGE